MIRKMPYNGEWFIFSDEDVAKLNAHSPGQGDSLMEEYREYEKNPLAHFLPHGVKWHKGKKEYAGGRIILHPSEYPKKWLNDGVAFQNDWTSDYVMLKAPRKTGKSFAGAVKVFNFMCKTDKNWPCYSGVGGWKMEWKPWDGEKHVIVSSFGMQNLAELWTAYQESWPREELGPYAPGYPRMDLGEGDPSAEPKTWKYGRAKAMSFGDGRPKKFYPYISGGQITFLLYTQPLHVWMNFKADAWHADEQPQVQRINAFEDGARGSEFSPIWFTWSGFKLPDRPDTGMSGGMHGLWSGRDVRSKAAERSKKNAKAVQTRIGRYNMDVPSTPDAVIPMRKKKKLYDTYANPDIERDMDTERLGYGVYYPGDEPGAGLVFGPDVWAREIHVINPLWADDKVPRNWTKWRVTDYCDMKTTCTIWGAIGPKFGVIYRVLYEQGLTVFQAAKLIIKMSHNVMEETGTDEDENTGTIFRTFREIQSGEQYYADLLDSRMGSCRQQGVMIIDLFRRYGMEDIAPACGQKNVHQIPNLKDMLKIDWNTEHPFAKDRDGKPLMGASSLYFFDGKCEDLVDEIELIPADDLHVIDQKHPHDGIDCLKYFASDQPEWMGDEKDDGFGKEDGEDEYVPNRFTGY